MLFCDDLNSAKPQQGPSVTINTKYGIQSGGCVIQSSNVVLEQENGPRLQVSSKMSGGGCYVKKAVDPDYVSFSAGDEAKETKSTPLPLFTAEQLRKSFDQAYAYHRSHSTTARLVYLLCC